MALFVNKIICLDDLQQLPALSATVPMLVSLYLPDWRVEISNMHDLLSPEEQTRAARYRQTIDQERFIVARAMLRRLLSTALSVQANVLTFTTGTHGKPMLAGEQQNRIHFSLSHSGDWILYAFSSQAPVGMDVESMDRNVSILELAERFFTQEEYAHLQTCSHTETQRKTFFQLWTRKEAILKADGCGLSGIEGLSVWREGDTLQITFRKKNYQIQDLFVAANYAAAACFEMPPNLAVRSTHSLKR